MIKPELTVAAVIRQDDKYLFVREMVKGTMLTNQPAGHVEPGESPVEAVIRETHEESGYHFRPEYIIGMYLWRSPVNHTDVLRLAFHGEITGSDPDPVLDTDIIECVWLNTSQLPGEPLRSPLVIQVIEHFEAGNRYDLNLFSRIS